MLFYKGRERKKAAVAMIDTAKALLARTKDKDSGKGIGV